MVADLHVPAFCPAGIHAQEHVGPVLAFGTTCAGMDFDVAVIAVHFARQQRFDLSAPRRLLEFEQRAFGFLDHLGVAFGFTQLNQFDIVPNACFQLPHGLDGHVELIALAHGGAGLFRVVPEFGRFGLRGQRVETEFCSIPVKDASSARSKPARFRRRSFRFPYAWCNSFIRGASFSRRARFDQPNADSCGICGSRYRA